MTYQINTLLVGAGAEVDEPFFQLTGADYVLDICYYENTSLYKALEEFYKGRLYDGKRNNNSKAPGTYQDLFLYSPKSANFKKLAAHLCDNALENLLEFPELGRHLKDETINRQSCKRLADVGLKLLFEMLIRREDTPEAFENYKIRELKEIPSDTYFGTIEPYFSSLINPQTRNQSF